MKWFKGSIRFPDTQLSELILMTLLVCVIIRANEISIKHECSVSLEWKKCFNLMGLKRRNFKDLLNHDEVL